MTDIAELRFHPAEYRIRLFLSVDLSGSTAFKNSSSGENRERGSAPRWVTVFQQFYKDFPALFSSEFQKQKTDSVGGDGCPKLWKAVGDELVFCGTISNQKACIVALNAFISTLHTYRKRLNDEGVDLNVKGAGWLGAFPEPNRTVQLRPADGTPELHSASEALEVSADKAPFDYDFLGKAIDTGFRVAGNAKPERFILSVQLARLIVGGGADLGFGHQVRLDRPLTLKGVNRNEPYPVLYIDTIQHLESEKTFLLERELVSVDTPPNAAKLDTYLEAYCTMVGTDEIKLKVDATVADIEPPDSYIEHKALIETHLQSMVGKEFDGANGGEDEGEGEGEATELDGIQLEPLKPDPA